MIRLAKDEPQPDHEQLQRDYDSLWLGLARQVSRETAALEANQELPFGEIASQDIVDDAIRRARRHLAERPAEVPMQVWLYEQAREVLKKRREQVSARAGRSGAAGPQGKPAPPPPTPLYLTLDEERLMDLVVPAPGAPSGETNGQRVAGRRSMPAGQRKQLRQALHEAVTRMPAAWRETIWLYYLDGFNLSQIAALQQREESEVREDLELAVSSLRDSLRD